jgi:hypothetical protein
MVDVGGVQRKDAILLDVNDAASPRRLPTDGFRRSDRDVLVRRG